MKPLQECNADGMECRDAERMNASTQVEISECRTEHGDDQALQQREAYQEALIAPPLHCAALHRRHRRRHGLKGRLALTGTGLHICPEVTKRATSG